MGGVSGGKRKRDELQAPTEAPQEREKKPRTEESIPDTDVDIQAFLRMPTLTVTRTMESVNGFQTGSEEESEEDSDTNSVTSGIDRNQDHDGEGVRLR